MKTTLIWEQFLEKTFSILSLQNLFISISREIPNLKF